MYENEVILKNLNRLCNQTYKLLPLREENKDWEKINNTIIIEIKGLIKILSLSQQSQIFSILCKLEGLKDLTADEDFLLFRKTVFECLNLFKVVQNEYK